MQSFYSNSFLIPLFAYFTRLHPITDALKRDYEANCKSLQIKKNKFIVSPLDQNEYLYFINSGLVRGFIKNKGKDITTRFSFEHEIIGAIRHPDGLENYSVEYLQALDDCELVKIPYAFIELVYQKYPEAQIIGRKIFAQHYHAASERSILARIPNAADRYSMFIDQNINDINRLPLKFQASYLGIRIETLSRIRSRTEGITAVQTP